MMQTQTKSADISLSVSYVKPEDVDSVWPYVCGFIEDAMSNDPGGYDPDHFKQELEEGLMLLWVVTYVGEIVAAAVTEFVQKRERILLSVVALGGYDSNLWGSHLEEAIIKYGQEQLVDGVQAYCRDGLSKILKSRGWRKTANVMEYSNGFED